MRTAVPPSKIGRRYAVGLGAILLLTSVCAPTERMAPPRSTPLPQPATDSLVHVQAEFSGAQALAIVAFMDHHWRLPGNTGFNASIERVVKVLSAAGYVEEANAAPNDRLIYRVEHRPMRRNTWEPIDASLSVVGESAPILRYATNRNMVAINSNATRPGGVTGRLIDVGKGTLTDFAGKDVSGAIVMGEGSLSRLFRAAVVDGGALGVLHYGMPSYNQAATHPTSIPFRRVPGDPNGKGWGLMLSHGAHQRLKDKLRAGPVELHVRIDAKSYRADELTLIAEVRGSVAPQQRFVFSAHVQEPGANDNASGVATQAEMARVAAALLRAGTINPQRTITFLFGDEISAIARYLQEDATRTAGVRWGISLDMVGEDTAKTGGTFLIEKMPDPSAIWTRGDDAHTEWGRGRTRESDFTPHYFNDFVLARCLEQSAATGWVVKTNPYEGGSDHVPFLRAGVPGLLLWHFTDVYYHTDGDRLDKVSPVTMTNVGVSALVVALRLASPSGALVQQVLDETLHAGITRIRKEAALSRAAMDAGADRGRQRHIVEAWRDWYDGALDSVTDVPLGKASSQLTQWVNDARRRFADVGKQALNTLSDATSP